MSDGRIVELSEAIVTLYHAWACVVKRPNVYMITPSGWTTYEPWARDAVDIMTRAYVQLLEELQVLDAEMAKELHETFKRGGSLQHGNRRVSP
jgi:hypothetical protein